MKLNIKGLVFVGFAAAVFASAANAAGEEKTVTSVKFTEATYQKKLTADSPISISADNHISTTAQANVIEGVTVNGNATTVTNKIADVSAITGVKTSAGETLTPTNGVVTLPANTVDTNTTYTFAEGNTPKAFQVTDSATNTAQTVTINGLGSAAEADVSTTGVAADENDLVTGAQVAAYVGSQPGATAYTGTGVIDVTDHVISTTAQENVIETITVGGTAANVTGKTVALGAAAGKGAATTIASTSTDSDVATAKAVYDYVGAQPGATAYTGTGVIDVTNHVISTTAQENTIETVKVNGTALTIDANKAVDITVPNTPNIPTPAANTCTAAAPCALVWAGDAPTWEPIQQ